MFVDDEKFKKYLKLINLESDYEIIKENLFETHHYLAIYIYQQITSVSS